MFTRMPARVMSLMSLVAPPSSGATVAVQGFGNAGSIAARLLQGMGAKIVAVSDSRGGVHNAAGIDACKVSEAKAREEARAYG